MKSNVIILDANFILLPFQFKIDYLKEIRNNVEGRLKFIVYKQVLDELEAKEKRESRATKFKKLLSSGLLYLKNNEKIHVIDYVNDIKGENENTDDFLLRKVIDLKGTFKSVFLATNDSELRNRSKKLSISVIFLRQKKYLSFERA